MAGRLGQAVFARLYSWTAIGRPHPSQNEDLVKRRIRHCTRYKLACFLRPELDSLTLVFSFTRPSVAFMPAAD